MYFKKWVHFIKAIKFIGMKLFATFPYYHFNTYRFCHDAICLIVKQFVSSPSFPCTVNLKAYQVHWSSLQRNSFGLIHFPYCFHWCMLLNWSLLFPFFFTLDWIWPYFGLNSPSFLKMASVVTDLRHFFFSLYIKNISCRQHMVGFCLLIHPDNMSLNLCI